jgi:hypothetical protein
MSHLKALRDVSCVGLFFWRARSCMISDEKVGMVAGMERVLLDGAVEKPDIADRRNHQ